MIICGFLPAAKNGKVLRNSALRAKSVTDFRELPKNAMKYLFCKDVTRASEKACAEEQRFLTTKLPQTHQDGLNAAEKALEQAQRRHRRPVWLEIVRHICLGLGLIIALGVAKGLRNVTPAQAYRNAPGLIWAGAALLLVGGVLSLSLYIRERRSRRSESTRAARKRYNAAVRSAEACLGVPSDSAYIEILRFSYSREASGIHIRKAALCAQAKCFRAGGALRISDGETIYSLPLSELTGITVLEHGIPLLGWNQRSRPNGRHYRLAGVMPIGRMGVGLRFCCALELTHEGERFALLFPAYELPAVQALTKLPAPKLPAVTFSEKHKKKRKETRKRTPIKMPPSDGKVHPLFYWHFPSGDAVLFWSSPVSDIEFRIAHPKLYGLLVTIGILVLILPTTLFTVITGLLRPVVNAWILLGVLGGFIMGIGLFNVVSAWLHQYLGHIVTLVCIGTGAVLMAVSALLL